MYHRNNSASLKQSIRSTTGVESFGRHDRLAAVLLASISVLWPKIVQSACAFQCGLQNVKPGDTRWVSEEEKDERKNEGLCLRCGAWAT
jgi:hypothetical protein